MHTTKMVVTVAIAPLFLAAIANAQLTFAEVETQHWSDPLNWSPVGPPSASDLAIIPIGETCKVINPNATAHNLEVYGTLGIVSRQLTIVKNVTVDGTIYLEKTAAVIPKLVCLAIDSKITGSGTVTAAKPNYGPGVLEWRDASCPSTLLIDTNVTVKGSMTIISNVTVKGLLLVDHASDTMILNSFDCIEGSGTFQATAGVLRIDSASGDIDNAMDYVVDGGTINCKAGTFDTTGVVTVSSGTLDLDQNFVCTGGITFSGGNINVAANKCAVFSDTAD